MGSFCPSAHPQALSVVVCVRGGAFDKAGSAVNSKSNAAASLKQQQVRPMQHNVVFSSTGSCSSCLQLRTISNSHIQQTSRDADQIHDSALEASTALLLQYVEQRCQQQQQQQPLPRGSRLCGAIAAGTASRYSFGEACTWNS